jgi:hypothetical protein
MASGCVAVVVRDCAAVMRKITPDGLLTNGNRFA